MSQLNYHHLRYFWVVARKGGVARAAAELHVSQPTISNQLKTLEASLGHRLLERRGRGLALTDVGRTVLRYAEDIFRAGAEMEQALRGAPTRDRMPLVVGVTDVIPKILVTRLLRSAVAAVKDVRLTCREGAVADLLADLARHEVDVVLSDAPAPEPVKVKAFSHLLAESGVVFLAAPRLAHLRRDFPRSLSGAPLLLPAQGTALRQALDRWLEARGLAPAVVGEFDDSAVLMAFGSHGMGIFAAPSVVERDVSAQLGVRAIGRADGLRERFYALSVERKLRHPGVVAIAEAARAPRPQAGA